MISVCSDFIGQSRRPHWTRDIPCSHLVGVSESVNESKFSDKSHCSGRDYDEGQLRHVGHSAGEAPRHIVTITVVQLPPEQRVCWQDRLSGH